MLADRTQTIRASVKDVEITLLITITLVVIVIFLFLRDIRATLIPSALIPLSLLATTAVMLPLGFSLDNLSLMALTIAVGFVVDDAIVMSEVIWRRIEAGDTPFDAALAGADEISFTILTISISLIVVFTPLMFMGGVVGLLMREFAITLSVAVLLSLFLSLTLTPMLCAKFLKAPKPASNPLTRMLEKGIRQAGSRLCERAGRSSAPQARDAGRVRGDGRGGDLALRDRFHRVLSPAGTPASSAGS